MSTNSQPAGDRIILSSAALNLLAELSAAPLKVYVYLCSCSRGQPIEASIPTIQKATGFGNRTVVTALKTLREHKLISRNPGKGNRPNQYQIVLPALPSPAPEPPVSPKAAETAQPAKSAPQTPAPEPASPTIKDLTASLAAELAEEYRLAVELLGRAVTQDEMNRLQAAAELHAYNPGSLRRRLKVIRDRGLRYSDVGELAWDVDEHWPWH